MKLIKVRYTKEKLEILEGEGKFLENGRLPDKFLTNLQTLSLIRCESLTFKYNIGNDLYRIKLTGEHEIYLFHISLITEIKKTSDTDQMLDVISKKYLSDEESFDPEEDPSKMLLSIYLELRKLKIDLESKQHLLLDKLQTSENYLTKRLEEWKEELEEQLTDDFYHKNELVAKLEKEYIQKEDFTLGNLLSKTTKRDLIILLFVLIMLATLADMINVRKVTKDIIEKPIELIK